MGVGGIMSESLFCSVYITSLLFCLLQLVTGAFYKVIEEQRGAEWTHENVYKQIHAVMEAANVS